MAVGGESVALVLRDLGQLASAVEGDKGAKDQEEHAWAPAHPAGQHHGLSDLNNRMLHCD